MNCQNCKPFPPCHSLRRMHHLLKPHSPLPLNNMLKRHSNLTTQALYLLRPYPIALHIGTSKISWPVPYTMPGTTTCSHLLLTKNLAFPYFHKPKTCLKNTFQTRLKTLSSTSPWSYEKPLSFWTHHSNKQFSLSLHCHRPWKIDWLEKGLSTESTASIITAFNPDSHKQNYLAKQNPSVSFALTPDLPSHQQNSSKHALTLK